MYIITVNGIDYEVILPCYVYYNELIESYMTCDESKAEAIYLYISEEEAIYCDIDYKRIRHANFPVAHIEEVTNGE